VRGGAFALLADSGESLFLVRFRGDALALTDFLATFLVRSVVGRLFDLAASEARFVPVRDLVEAAILALPLSRAAFFRSLVLATRFATAAPQKRPKNDVTA